MWQLEWNLSLFLSLVFTTSSPRDPPSSLLWPPLHTEMSAREECQWEGALCRQHVLVWSLWWPDGWHDPDPWRTEIHHSFLTSPDSSSINMMTTMMTTMMIMLMLMTMMIMLTLMTTMIMLTLMTMMIMRTMLELTRLTPTYLMLHSSISRLGLVPQTILTLAPSPSPLLENSLGKEKNTNLRPLRFDLDCPFKLCGISVDSLDGSVLLIFLRSMSA